MSRSSIGAMEMHKCAFNTASSECNNLPWPVAVSKAQSILLWGQPPDSKNHVANIQWKSQLGLQSMVGKACFSAEG